MTRHKHADVIHAWAEGAEIQTRNPLTSSPKWIDNDGPTFCNSLEYRIKPKIVKREGWVNIYRTKTYPKGICVGTTVWATKENAEGLLEDLVATVKVEWEETE